MSSTNKAAKVMVLGLDGADPTLVSRYIAQGKLPNFKKALELGSAAADLSMQSVLPAITPPNWASIATGAYPSTHGITCFWNHTLGNELDVLDYGFDSGLLKAETIWQAYARAGKKSIVFNYPTSWPPQAEDSIYVDGTSIYTNLRGYVDYEKVVEGSVDQAQLIEVPHTLDNTGANCRFEGEETTQKAGISKETYDGFGYSQPGLVTTTQDGELSADVPTADWIRTPIGSADGWASVPPNARAFEFTVNGGAERRWGLVVASSEGAGAAYDTIRVYADRQSQQSLGEAKSGCWSGWIYDTYRIGGADIPVAYKIRVLELDAAGDSFSFYVSYALDLKTGKFFHPRGIGEELYTEVGPMLQPSNYSRLTPLADEVLLESIEEMYRWHVDAINYLLDNKEWDLFYTHMHGIDMFMHFYLDHTLEAASPEYERYQEIVYRIYEITDRFIGALLERLDGKTSIFIVSDHGGVAKNPETDHPLIGDMWGINVGILGELGYTAVKDDGLGGKEIDWSRTTAVAQRATFIYLNVKGRDPQGIVDPADYDAVVRGIIDDLYNYRDPKTGRRVISFALNRNDMEVVGLGGENSGDIFYILEPDFTRCHGNGLSNHSLSGYSMKALFIALGAGIKQNQTIDRKVKVVDIVPTLCALSGAPVPYQAEGGVLYQIFEGIEQEQDGAAEKEKREAAAETV
ncbi:alkaline phosphatase family protein [Saccharibacillus sp. CPCC 101409]|uniref:alkaline phosphatase family protein n=1 Tax=Saccharibacillus sp. CPCC 101409 TaxID=3058041 RepID=UPI00267167DE|nr:alkaline phosphatase family protein [Saccharibacillus sp. CPCC 101409]MDO3410191.1 alkaline phosphatase family protein [Saccharibacillus sp. CPCC 101409]